ncbi:DegT/DnrJ/EryC1/StrS family aminotransferase [Oceanotoga sp. DSM 15011]|uniref:DegT/DnrJ/EryC1/StrS aminotransferase family protein n=1 Tax=Oceanotoga sp. DSM 15011 TaxID=2984951 RepID=UPI0021F47D4C|nr:DegT/DnrJ/EryC1/StrS family aminotransferase [Oceanotoga sp. DSM 15011]UYO99189.1 DegT/DnrJ/EryC1/StrS family aminotransferase [Oceanotoga sp. DSM 15011]
MRLNEIWRSNYITNMGRQHDELEKTLKTYLNVNNLLLFNNGTTALILGLKALDLKGEVITTPFTFPATLEALDWCGLKPVFCDIDKNTLNIDIKKIEKKINKNTTAILAVHVFGNPCEVYEIDEIAKKYNLKVIYDGAHIFGSTFDKRSLGSFGDMTMFSFHATKIFHTVEGGALAFKDDVYAKKLKMLRNFGISDSGEILLSGINAKLNEIQAAIGLEVLKMFDLEKNKRLIIKKIYEDNLKDIDGIKFYTDKSSSQQYFVVGIDEKDFGISRDFLYEKLKKYNIYTKKYFSPLCSTFNWYSDLETAKKENLLVANKVVNEVIALPFYGDLNEDEIKRSVI